MAADPAVLGMPAVTGEGFCGLAFGPGPAAFHSGLPAYQHAPGLMQAPLVGAAAAQGLAALGGSGVASVAPAPAAAGSNEARPAVHAEPQNPPVLPSGACRASEQALARKGAPDFGYAVHAEARAVHAGIHFAPATTAATQTGLAAQPMWRAAL